MEIIKIRQATLNDLENLLILEQELIRAERPFDVCIREDPVVYYDLRSMLESRDVLVAVAEIDGQIVSCGYAKQANARPYLDHENYAYLGFMFTLDQFRGRGVNGKIMEFLSSWAETRGLKELRLTVYQDNLPAIKAYEKAGFEKHIVEMRIRKP